MKGYKGFDKDLKCRGFQYEVGKTYECKGGVVLCENGFHFCEDPKNIRGYYADLPACRYCEIEASGEIIEGDGKCVCSEIKIVREIPSQEFLALVNEGSRNTGWANEGDCNKGDFNKGDCNKGDFNKGDCNKGDGNEGDDNEGNDNKGDANIGSFNRGNDLCGLFNTDGGCIIFNRYTPMKHTDIEEMCGFRILFSCMSLGRMPDSAELEEIKKLPNFDEAVMRELILGKESKK